MEIHSIIVIAQLTLAEARRRRIVIAALLCALVLLAVFSTGAYFAGRAQTTTFIERQTMFTVLSLAGMYNVNFLSILFAVLLPVDSLSGEIDSGVMQTLAVKPVHRSAIVIGKWLGNALLVTGYISVLAVGVLLSVRFFGGFSPVYLTRALPLMLLEVVLLTTVSIAGGTRFSTVTNGILGLGYYGIAFIGGWLEQVGALSRIDALRNIGVASSLISPADAMWRLAAYKMQPPLMRNTAIPLWSSLGGTPTGLMVWWTAACVVLIILLAIRTFARRDL